MVGYELETGQERKKRRIREDWKPILIGNLDSLVEAPKADSLRILRVIIKWNSNCKMYIYKLKLPKWLLTKN